MDMFWFITFYGLFKPVIPVTVNKLFTILLGNSDGEKNIRDNIQQLKIEQNAINMVNEFPKHAKLQRRINKLTEELKAQSSERNMTRLKFQYGSSFATYIILGIITIYLVWSSPPSAISKIDGNLLFPLNHLLNMNYAKSIILTLSATSLRARGIEATKQFQEIQQAYEVLSKSSERNRYDFQQREYRSNPGSRSSASDFREQYYRRAQYYHRHEKTNYHWDPDEEMRRHQSYNARRRQWEEDIRRQGGGQQSSSGNPWGDSFKASWEQPAYGQRRSNVAVVRFCFVVMFIGALLHLFAYEQSQQQRAEAFRSMVLKARKSEESRAASRAAMQADREAFLETWGRQQEDFERNHYKNDRS
ncbi:hypothetical protein HDE_00433 [Halotydeus destructor]|nr:hypothetical protein HDE_00433 [Halotydeus destructor]